MRYNSSKFPFTVYVFLIGLIFVSLNVFSIPVVGTKWIFPAETPGTAGKFEKLEIGIRLEEEVEKHIDNFIYKNISGEKLNPFNPEDIDIRAEFSLEVNRIYRDTYTRYAFFYEEFSRQAHKNSWNKIENDHRFRIRFAPPETGNWRCIIYVNIKGGGFEKADEFNFTTKPSSNKGFVKVSKNNRFLSLGGETFFPAGQNLPVVTCYNCPPNVPCAGIEDYCAEIMGSAGYLVYHKEMSALKKAGGNYFRLSVTPWNLEIEYEELGNYYRRMPSAWEMDRILDKAKELDLKVHLIMQSQFALEEVSHYQKHYWDWKPNHPCVCNPSDDIGYCYARELNISPIEFLDDNRAIKHYKNRLRYMIARWGYSTEIAMLELVSEINNIGATAEYDVPSDPCNINCPVKEGSIIKPYGTDPSLPFKVYQWQKEMLYFIKEGLKHKDQLLAVNYAGQPYFHRADESYFLKEVDVATYNHYRTSADRRNIIPEIQDVQGRIFMRTRKVKPVIFGEVGAMLYPCDNDTEYLKDIWLTSFSGLAGTAMNWKNTHPSENWVQLGNVRSLIGNTDLGNGNWMVGDDVRSDRAAEMMCLQNKKERMAIGVISNTTYNYWTQNTLLPVLNKNTALMDTSECRKAIFYPGDPLSQAIDITAGSGGNALKIFSMGRGVNYRIEWYNALTNTLISETKARSSFWGKLKLDFPGTLTGGTESPMISFKVYKEE